MMSEAIELPRGSTLDLPLQLTDAAGAPITFAGRLWFMVKESECDADEDAIIDKEITIDNTDGTPYHGILHLTLEDSGHAVTDYKYDLKTKVGSGDWKSADMGIFKITNTIRHGNPT